MLIRHNTLILVADGKKFLLLRNAGGPHEPALVFEGSGQKDDPATHDQGTDRPGRRVGYGTAHSAMEQTDFHQIEEDLFAGEVAEILDKLAQAQDFGELIVVAPPRALAQLRKRFGRAVSSRIVAEIDKDLTKHPVDEIAMLLSREPL
jgi:protein required for attachment to host cells